MKYLLTFALLLAIAVAQPKTAAEQQECAKILQEGKTALNGSSYEIAFKKLAAARKCNPASADEIDQLIQQAFFKIEEDRKQLIIAEKTAKEALAKVQRTLNELQTANKDRVNKSLQEMNYQIFRMRYDSAMTAALEAANLGLPEALSGLAELSFYFIETGNTQQFANAYTLLEKGMALSKHPKAKDTLLTHIAQPITNSPETYGKLKQAVKYVCARVSDTTFAALTKKYYPTLLPVAAGTFQMGFQKESKQYPKDATEITHPVTLSAAYEIGRTEITMWQWGLYCNTFGRVIKLPTMAGDPIGGSYPAMNVSWYDAVKYCNWLSQRQGLPPAYAIDSVRKDLDNRNISDSKRWIVTLTGSNGYRLPTEAEWEYAARGGAKGASMEAPYIFAGSDTAQSVAWYSLNSLQRPRAVAIKTANTLGVYDMSGNVAEWCWDWNAPYTADAQTNPTGESYGMERVFRGGAWNKADKLSRVTARKSFPAETTTPDLGFRIARSAK